MTEETKPAEKPAAKETSDEVKALATKLGWNPDYDGDERKKIGAEEYILRSREIQDTTAKTLRSTKIQMGKLEKGFEALKTHNEQVYKVNVANLKKEVKALRKQRKEAEEDGDDKLVKEIDNEINEIKKIPNEAPVQHTQTNPDFERWREKNTWYDDNSDMRLYADAQGEDPELKALPLDKFFAAVTKRVKQYFPEEFPAKKQKETPKVSAVEGSTPTKKDSKKHKFTLKDLNEDQKNYAKFFEERGIKTTEEYIDELVTIGELK